MRFLIYLFSFSFGLIVGSFLNCVIYRLHIGKGFLEGRSYCPSCKHILTWQDLIPVLSFLILRGRCRYCKKPISIQYPLVEFTTGILFTFIVFQNITSLFYGSVISSLLNIFFLFLVSCFLIIIFVYDLKHYIIPDRVIYPAILAIASRYLIADVFLNLYTRNELVNVVYSALGAGAFFLAIVLFSRGKGMGMGDVKLAFFMGLLLGFPNILVALFLSFFIGATVGVILIVLRKRSFKSEVPFAPFLVTGTFLVMFFSEEIIDYLNLILLK